MSEKQNSDRSRRDFLKDTGRVAAVSALTSLATSSVHAAEDNTLQVALVGCGGRGTGAVANALRVKQGPVKLVAMADVFENQLQTSLNSLKNNESFSGQIDVPQERQFIGFDAYKKAMDCLKPGDVAIFTTPLVFRWVHFEYAIEKGLNVFMEKPVTADGPTSRRMLDLAALSKEKNLKVGVGLMSRHQRSLQHLAQRVHDGEIGDIVMMRAYRMTGPVGSAFSTRWPGSPSELLWQIQRFHSFIWASGGSFSDFMIHVIDHCCWMKDAWPVKAQALGGRHYRGECVDQNFDSYSVEYTFEDGAKLIADGRCIAGCEPIYKSYAHGTKGSAIVSKAGDCGSPSSIFSGQSPESSKTIWESTTPPGESNPYDNEWNALVNAIRHDQPYNEVERGVMASMVTSLGRFAAHSGQEITLDMLLNSEEEYAPGVDQLTMDSVPPVKSDNNGNYPIPMPGLIGPREYEM